MSLSHVVFDLRRNHNMGCVPEALDMSSRCAPSGDCTVHGARRLISLPAAALSSCNVDGCSLGQYRAGRQHTLCDMLRCCCRAHIHCALQLDVVQVVLVVTSALLFADIISIMLLHY